MVIKTDPIISEVIVDTTQVKKASEEVKLFARDTKKELDRKVLIQLQTNSLKLEDEIRDVKKQLKDPALTRPEEIELRIQLGELKSNLTEAKRQLQNYRNTGDKELSRLQAKFNQTNKTIKEQGGLINNLKNGMTNLGGIIAGAFAFDQIIEFGKRLFNITSRLESVRNSFITLTGSIEETNELIRQLDEFAVRSPFNRLGIQEATQRLIGFGFESGEAVRALRAIGEGVSAVGGNQAVFDGVVTAIGQIEAKGKISAEELLQLAERGIPAYNILQEKLNLTGEEVANIGNAGISARDGINALLEGLEERFGGSLEKQTQTLQGRLSNLVDIFEIRLGQLGSGLSGSFQNVISTLSGLLLSFQEKDIVSFGNTVGSVFDSTFSVLVESVRTAFNITETALRGIGDTITFVFNGFQATTQQIENARNSGLNLFQTFAVGLKTIGESFSLVLTFTQELASDLPNVFIVSAQNIGKIFENLSINVVTSIGNIVQGAVNQINRLSKFANSILPDFAQLGTIGNIGTGGEFVGLTDGLRDFGGQFDNTSRKAKTFFSEINNEINKLQNSTGGENVFGVLSFGDPKKNDPFSNKSGSSTKSNGEQFEELKKFADDTFKFIADNAKKRLEDVAKKTNELANSVKGLIQGFGQEIEKQEDKIKGFTDEIQKANSTIDQAKNKIDSINQSTTEQLAGRLQTVQGGIGEATLNNDTQKLAELNEELRLINNLKNIDEIRAVVAEEKRRAELTDTQRILEDAQKEIQLQEEIIAKEQERISILESQKATEEQVLANFLQKQIELEEGYTKRFGEELEKRLDLVRTFSERARDSALGTDLSGAVGTTNSNSTVNQNISVTVDGVSNPDEVRQAVTEAITQASIEKNLSNI